MAETILIVDDEPPVRKTFQEWLDGAEFDAVILSVADAEAALTLANQHTIDLAILDWNLGAGNNGLQLLEDLALFNPAIAAIMITGYAHQATPLDAMRMGVRDYLDKNQDLHREAFLAVVRKQLDRLRPAKRERQLHRSLAAFRDAVEKVLPLVQTAAALNDPVPFTSSVRQLFRFLLRTTAAADGALLVRSYDVDRRPAELYRAYNIDGEPLDLPLVPFPQSLAGSVLSLQEPCVMTNLGQALQTPGVQLQPFERGRKHLLAVPLHIGPGVSVVLELFDKTPAEAADGFTAADRRLVAAAADFGAALLQHALAERERHGMLFAAVVAALQASDRVADSLQPAADSPQEGPPPPVLQQLRRSMEHSPLGLVDADQALPLAQLLRTITVRHGPEATRHCIQLLESVDRLLTAVAGSGEAQR